MSGRFEALLENGEKIIIFAPIHGRSEKKTGV
jgi:hypothetical protein